MTRRVAIIGGGLSGLAAAEWLNQHNRDAGPSAIDVTLFEAKRMTGGRAGSFVTADAVAVDYCQHVAMGSCTTLLALLERAGLIEFWRRYEQLTFAHPDHPSSRFAALKWLPPPLHLLPTVAAMKYLTISEKFRLAAAMQCLWRSEASALLDQTAAQWLKQHWQTERLLQRFWRPILVSALGESIDRVSMAPARKTIVDGFMATADAADVWVPQLPLSEMFGIRLPQFVVAAGTDIRCGHSIRHISAAGSQVVVDDTVFDAVILAVPWYRWTTILDASLAAAIPNFESIAAIGSSPITGIHLWFDRPVMRCPHVVMLETTAQWLFAAPAKYGNDPLRGHYVQVVISASAATHSGRLRDPLVRMVCDEIRALAADVVTADARESVLNDAKIVTDPRSVFSVTPATERIRPPAQTQHPGLFLASDIVATGWPSTMEGAVISGQMAAKLAAQSLATPPT